MTVLDWSFLKGIINYKWDENPIKFSFLEDGLFDTYSSNPYDA